MIPGLDALVAPVQKAGARRAKGRDRFDAARGKAQIKWRTDDLMELLRGKD
jgi:hypothetical protein